MRITFGFLGDLASSSWDVAKNIMGDELLRLQTTINNVWDANHNSDGTHGDVVADSLELQGARVGEFTDLPYDAARFTGDGSGTWIVGSTDFQYLRFARVGQLVWLEFCVNNTETTAAPEYLVIKLPEFGPLFTRDTQTLSASHGTVHNGGSWFSQDNVAPYDVDSGLCALVTTNVGGQSAAELHLQPLGTGFFPTTTDLYVCGSTMFPINFNNRRNPFPA